jgi:hypothetical protein
LAEAENRKTDCRIKDPSEQEGSFYFRLIKNLIMGKRILIREVCSMLDSDVEAYLERTADGKCVNEGEWVSGKITNNLITGVKIA